MELPWIGLLALVVDLALFSLVLAILPSELSPIYETASGKVILVIILSILTLFLVVSRPYVVLRMSFNSIYQIRSKAGWIAVAFLGLSLAPSFLVPQVWTSLSPALRTLFVLTMFQLAAIWTVITYYGDVFNKDNLAALCFGQAIESKNRNSKLSWIRNGFKHLREVASDSRLDLDRSKYEHFFAIRLFEYENVDADIENIRRVILEKKPLVPALKQIEVNCTYSDALLPRKGWRERLSAHVEPSARYIQLLYIALALAFLVLQETLKVVSKQG